MNPKPLDKTNCKDENLIKGKCNYEPLGRTLGKLLRTRFNGRTARARDETFGVARSNGLERFANGRDGRAGELKSYSQTKKSFSCNASRT